MSCLSEKWRALTWGNAGKQMDLESPRVAPGTFHLSGGQTLTDLSGGASTHQSAR